MLPQTRAEHARALWNSLHTICAERAPVELSTLAAVAGYSSDHLNCISRALLGTSISAAAAKIRLNKAACALATSDIPIWEVALSTGYATPEAFAKAFHTMFGMAPSRYRLNGVLPPDSGLSWERVRSGFLDMVDGALTMTPSLKIAACRHIGDYRQIPSVWRRMATLLPESQVMERSARWVTVFHSDGMRKHNRSAMTAHLGFVFEEGLVPRGFEIIHVPASLSIQSGLIVGSHDHSCRWAELNRRWVKKPKIPSSDQPAYDTYTEFPVDWRQVSCQISLAVD